MRERIRSLPIAVDAVAARVASRLFTARIIALLLIILLLGSILPMLVVAKYDRPTDDDFIYTRLTKPVWEEVHSLSAVLSAALETAGTTYSDWQGSYSACFLMALQPGLFSIALYCLTPYVMLFALLSCAAVFLNALLVKKLQLERSRAAIVYALFCGICIHFLPSGAEAFYWWNGSIYYCFYFSLTLLLFACVVSGLGRRRTYGLCILTALLALFIAGGNLSTGFMTLLLLLFLTGLFIHLRRLEPVLLTATLFFIIGFLLNTLAPGNAMRMLSEGESRGAVTSIYLSIQYLVQLYADWFSLPVLFGCFLSALGCMPIIKRLATRSTYPCPLLVLLLLVLFNATGLTPLIYSGSYLTIPRLHNVVFFTAVLCAILGFAYLLGWCFCHKDYPARVLRKALVLLALMSLIALLPNPPFNPSTQKEVSGLSAYHSLINRDAYRFARSYDRRLAILLDDSVRVARVHPIPHHPELFIFRDFSVDAASNAKYAAYYNKDAILLYVTDAGDAD